MKGGAVLMKDVAVGACITFTVYLYCLLLIAVVCRPVFS